MSATFFPQSLSCPHAILLPPAKHRNARAGPSGSLNSAAARDGQDLISVRSPEAARLQSRMVRELVGWRDAATDFH